MNQSLPDGIVPFLRSAGWVDAKIEPLPGDASFRRYFRVRAFNGHGGHRTAMLMDAPPPHEDTGPFRAVARWLRAHDHRAPVVYAEDNARGLVLLEDFGDDRMRDWLDDNAEAEDDTYRRAIDALVRLHASPPGPFAPYDLATYQREAGLLPEWYCPAMGLKVDTETYVKAWDEVLAPVLERQEPGVTVLRDYHAENIMLLADGNQGIIDFQDALVGHRAYDLVSLLQDARREVSPELERRMLEHYRAQVDAGPDFEADYTTLGAQRNAKIVGIFARLWKRDDKPRYLALIPRVWEALERDLKHPALAPVDEWFAANIPQEIRDTFGGELM
ncbi:aminoglycoside phosphotransferase family protein [Altericroceibacterium xinjiangense]|uniref:aminoglycoside phosphotransferase family protein n=1 Tax=Altericroceibacterium xinjiangense TaxID=762261 RepID=UPI000F7E6530|nr:phosphotransferase [Altericroceibacterium xinjiangense]